MALGRWEACLCYFHANPDKASELGQSGGKAKGPRVTADPVEYVTLPLKTVNDVTHLLADAINDLRSGAIEGEADATTEFRLRATSL